MSQEFEGTMPVRDTHRFDETKLEQYLAAHVAGFEGPLQVVQFKGGQSNPTFGLVAGSGRYVPRRTRWTANTASSPRCTAPTCRWPGPGACVRTTASSAPPST